MHGLPAHRHRQARVRHAPGYLAAVVITPVLVLLPPYHDVDLDGVTARYGTLFAMAARPAGQTALIGLLLVAALLLLALAAVVWPTRPGLPTMIIVLAGVVLLLLVIKPDTVDPPYTAAGRLMLLVAAGTVVNAALHAAFLHGARAEVRSGPPPGRPPAGARSGSRP